MKKPILSICIPTYNRANLLRVCLEAVIAQIIQLNGQVEVVVADNASDDDTAKVLSSFKKLSPEFPYIRSVTRPSNEGALNNVLTLATKDAKGEYVLIIGDDDLFCPGAILRITEQLLLHPEYDVFYTNFYVEYSNDQWPKTAIGGFSNNRSRKINEQTDDRHVDSWIELLNAHNEMGTHVYSHIVRRKIWQEYWEIRDIEPIYSSLHSTYPHTAMLLETVSDQPAYYLGLPNLTAFYGTTSWSANRSQIFLAVLPKLLSTASRRGLSPSQQVLCCDWTANLMANELIMSISNCDKGMIRNLFAGFTQNWRDPVGWKVYMLAIKKVGRKRFIWFLLNACNPFHKPKHHYKT